MARLPSPRLLERLVAALSEDLLIKLAALLGAIGIWAWVQSGLLDEERVRAEVQYLWPDGLVRADDVPATVVLTVRAPKAALATLSEAKPSITVDLREQAEGKAEIDFTTYTPAGLPSAASVVQITPATTQITLERRTTRELPIKPAIIGEPAEGHRVVAVRVRPEKIKVSGPRSIIKRLDDALTDVVDLSGIKDSRKVRVPLAPIGAGVQPVSNEPVEVEIVVEAVRSERHFTEAAVRTSAEGWLISPAVAHVVLDGPVAALNGVPADQVLVRVTVPDAAAEGPVVVTAGEGPGHFQVEFGAREGVNVQRVDPSTFTLEKIAP